MLLWAAGVFSYVAYVFESTEDTHWTDPSCGSGRGCEVLKGLLSWFAVFIQLSTLGLAFYLPIEFWEQYLCQSKLAIPPGNSSGHWSCCDMQCSALFCGE